jgi:single-stranded DNA-binding protein
MASIISRAAPASSVPATLSRSSTEAPLGRGVTSPWTDWHHCIDWEGRAGDLRKGDCIRVTGHRQTRRYLSGSEEKTYVQLVITGLQILKTKSRAQAA